MDDPKKIYRPAEPVEEEEEEELIVDTSGKDSVADNTRFMVTLEGVTEQFRSRVERSPILPPDPDTSIDSAVSSQESGEIVSSSSTTTTTTAMTKTTKDSEESESSFSSSTMHNTGKLKSNVVVVHPRITAPVPHGPREELTVTTNRTTGRTDGMVHLMPEENVPMDADGNYVSADVSMTPNGNHQQDMLERCKFWPNCRNGEVCPFVHPTTPCRMFPACRYGEKCLYIHPNCKFGDKCTRVGCTFTHARVGPSQTPGVGGAVNLPGAPIPHLPTMNLQKPRKPSVTTVVYKNVAPKTTTDRSGTPCKFGGNCKNPVCTFLHPKPCKFGTSCSRPNCPFSHGKFGSTPSAAPVIDRSKFKWVQPNAVPPQPAAAFTLGAPAPQVAEAWSM